MNNGDNYESKTLGRVKVFWETPKATLDIELLLKNAWHPSSFLVVLPVYRQRSRILQPDRETSVKIYNNQYSPLKA